MQRLALLLLLAAGCETTAARCAFTACGGLLEGHWTIKDHCPAAAPACPGARVEAGGVKVEGSVSFSGGTYSVALKQSGAFTTTVPLSCLPGVQSCAAVEDQMRGPDIQSVSCSGEAVCTCQASLRGETVTQSGTYRVSEERVILMSSGGEATTGEFCVAQDTLRLRSGMAAPPGPLPGSDEVLVLQR